MQMISRFLILTFLAMPVFASVPRAVDRVVAVVNNDVLTLVDLKARSAVVERQLQQQNIPLPPQDVFQKQVLERMIVERVQLQLAARDGIRVDDTQLDGAIKNIASSNNMSLDAFRQKLESDGVSWSTFRENIRNEMLIYRIREREVNNRIAVSEAEIDNYLAGAENSDASAEYELAHILIRVPEQANPEQVEKIQTRAENVLQQARAGTGFSQLAASFSDAQDALSGGGLGWRGADRLPTLYHDAVKKMSPGEISDVLRSPAGFHIVKLMSKRGGAINTQPVKQTHARHILIKVNEVVSESEAKHQLETLKERINHGADFVELARSHSNDLSASNGGDLGWLSQGDTVPDFERAMDALKPGELSVPVRSPFGWHLIQVLERRQNDSPEQKRQIVRGILHERKANDAYEEWLRQIRDEAYVEYRLDEQ